MNDKAEVNRAQIAQHAGVQRAAVSNWLSRHADFPRPTTASGGDLFDAHAVAAWLDRRPIPTGNLREGERVGQTYGSRFRHSLGLDPVPHNPTHRPVPHNSTYRSAEGAAGWDLADLVRGDFDHSQYLTVLAPLVYLRGRDQQAWDGLRESGDVTLVDESDLPQGELSILALSTLARVDRLTLRRAVHIVDRTVGSGKTTAAALFTGITEEYARRLDPGG